MAGWMRNHPPPNGRPAGKPPPTPAFDRLDRPTDSTETASFRFARLRPPKRDSVDSVDSVVMSTRRLAGKPPRKAASHVRAKNRLNPPSPP